MLCIQKFMNILPNDVVTFLLGYGESTATRKAVSIWACRSPAVLHPVFLDAIMQFCGLLITP